MIAATRSARAMANVRALTTLVARMREPPGLGRFFLRRARDVSMRASP